METTKTLMPTPINRGVVIKNPMVDVKQSDIILGNESKEDIMMKKTREMFPDGVMKFEVIAVDPNITQVKIGDIVSLNPTGRERAFSNPIKWKTTKNLRTNSDEHIIEWMSCSEGDINATWK
jgi:hypothetical protein